MFKAIIYICRKILVSFMHIWVNLHMCALVPSGGQKRASEPPNLGFRAVVSRLKWVLRVEFWICSRIASAFNCGSML